MHPTNATNPQLTKTNNSTPNTISPEDAIFQESINLLFAIFMQVVNNISV